MARKTRGLLLGAVGLALLASCDARGRGCGAETGSKDTVAAAASSGRPTAVRPQAPLSTVRGPARLSCSGTLCAESFVDFVAGRELVVAGTADALRAILESPERRDLLVLLRPSRAGEQWAFDPPLKPAGENKTVLSPGADGPLLTASSRDLMRVGDANGAIRVRHLALVGLRFKWTGERSGRDTGDLISVRRGAQGVLIAHCSFLGVGDEAVSVAYNYGVGGTEPVTVSIRHNTFDGGALHRHSYPHLFGSSTNDGGFRVEAVGNVYRGYRRRGCRAQGRETYVNCSGNVYHRFRDGVIEVKGGAIGLAGYNLFLDSPDPFDSHDFGSTAIWRSYARRADGRYVALPDRGARARFEARLPMPIGSASTDPFLAGLIAVAEAGPERMRRYVEERAGPSAPALAALRARVARLPRR